MIKKRGLTKLIVASLIFAAFSVWIFTTILRSYRRFESENSLNEVNLFARSLPAFRDYDEWIASLPGAIEGGKVMLLGLDRSFQFYPRYGDPLALAMWEANRDTWEFRRALEGVSFLLSSMVPRTFRVSELRSLPGIDPDTVTSPMRVFFLPIADESGFHPAGAVLMAVPQDRVLAFETLLRNLFIMAWVLFTVIFGVAILARDPITGYSVIFLFAMTLTFVAYPLVESFRLTFVQDGRFTFAIWQNIMQPHRLVALWNSIKLGLFTASISTFIGFIFAFVIERTSVRWKKFIGIMGTMPVISPPFSLTLSVILLFGNNGLISHQLLDLRNFSIYGLGGLVMVQTVCMFPIAFMTISSILKSIDSTVEDAALDLNASKLRTFFTITLPLAVPGILSAWLLVFTTSLADFANPMLLAGSFRVLSVEAFIEVTGRNNLGNGAALGLLLLLPTLLAFFIQRYIVARKSVVTVTGKPSVRLTELTTKPVRLALTAFVGLCVLFIMLLYGTIIAGCFVRNWGIDFTFTLENIPEALSQGRQAITNTLTLAAVATPIAGIIAMAGALIIVRQTFFGKRILEALLMTPFAIPGTLLGISFILAFNRPPLLLVGTAAIIVINYIVRELPVGLETGVANLRQIDKSIEEAAQDLGADMSKVFTSVVLPLIRPSFLTSMSYTFVRSMTAVSSVIFLISARWFHLTVQIFNFSELMRFGLASVLSTVLIIIVLAVFGLLKLVVRDRGIDTKTITL